jgi:hypothetical protein
MPLQRVPLPIRTSILPYDAHEKHPLTHFRNRNVCPQIEPDPGPKHRARNIQFAFLHIAAFKHFIAKANGRQAVQDEVRALTAAAHCLPVAVQAQLLKASVPWRVSPWISFIAPVRGEMLLGNDFNAFPEPPSVVAWLKNAQPIFSTVNTIDESHHQQADIKISA